MNGNNEMNIQEQIKEAKAKLAELEAQQLSEIKPGAIVWAWDDDCDERFARLKILKKVNGPKIYICQYNESSDTDCHNNIKVHSMPPSRDALFRAFEAGWDNNRRLINGELYLIADEWIERNFPEAI